MSSVLPVTVRTDVGAAERECCGKCAIAALCSVRVPYCLTLPPSAISGCDECRNRLACRTDDDCKLRSFDKLLAMSIHRRLTGLEPLGL